MFDRGAFVHEETYHGCKIVVTTVGRGAWPYRAHVNGVMLLNALRDVAAAVDYGKRHVRSLNSSGEPMEKRQCLHLQDGSMSKHSNIAFTTVPKKQNTTDYEWSLDVELCPLCSGIVRGTLSRVMAPAS